MKKYTFDFEIAIIGAGPAGISAALAAARRGRKVILVDKNGYLGGNATLGLPLLGFLDLDGRREELQIVAVETGRNTSQSFVGEENNGN